MHGSRWRIVRGLGVAVVTFLLMSTGGWAQVSPVTSSQSSSQMERPAWRVGDRWVYVGRNSYYGSAHEVDTVAGIADVQGKSAYVIQIEIEWTDVRGNKSVQRHTTVRDMDFALVERRDDHGNVTGRWSGSAWEKWPLVVGKHWTFEGIEEHQERGSWVKHRFTGSGSVAAIDAITTNAGTFKAFHIQHVVRWFDRRGHEFWRLDEDVWWSPDARTVVKYSDRDNMNTEEEELAEAPTAP